MSKGWLEGGFVLQSVREEAAGRQLVSFGPGGGARKRSV